MIKKMFNSASKPTFLRDRIPSDSSFNNNNANNKEDFKFQFFTGMSVSQKKMRIL